MLYSNHSHSNTPHTFPWSVCLRSRYPSLFPYSSIKKNFQQHPPSIYLNAGLPFNANNSCVRYKCLSMNILIVFMYKMHVTFKNTSVLLSFSRHVYFQKYRFLTNQIATLYIFMVCLQHEHLCGDWQWSILITFYYTTAPVCIFFYSLTLNLFLLQFQLITIRSDISIEMNA